MSDPVFTAEQVLTAKRELRDAAGAESASLTLAQVIGILSDEILLLRERGFSNQRIADLLTGFDIPVTGNEVVQYFRDTAREER